MHARIVVSALLICIGLPGEAFAQESARSGPRFQIFRYASRSALGMYSGYSAGPVLLVGGMLVNPRTEYREAMAAIGMPVGVPGGDVTVAVAGAHANTGWYAQLYLTPSLRVGPLAVDATFQLAEPLEATGSRGLYASPVNVIVPLAGRWSVGVGYYGAIEEGARPYHGVGPALQRAIPSGSVTVEWVFGVTGGDTELRATVRTAF